MVWQLDNSDFSIGIHTRDFSSGADFVPIFRIQAVIAAEFLNRFIFPIRPVGKCACHDLDRLRLADERAAQFADHQVRRIWSGFFVLCVADPQYIACVLYQSMLKASSGSHKRPVVFTGESNRSQCSTHTFVRTARSTPKGVKLLQCRPTASIIQ